MNQITLLIAVPTRNKYCNNLHLTVSRWPRSKISLLECYKGVAKPVTKSQVNVRVIVY